MRKLLLVLVVGLIAVPSMADILWEAHYNSGNNSADYAASGNVDPFSGSQATTPWVAGGYTGGAVQPIIADTTNLNYPVSHSNGNVNLESGTMTARVKVNFDSTVATSTGSVVCLGGSYDQTYRKFINLVYNNADDVWQWNMGSLSDANKKSYPKSNVVTFDSGDWIQLGIAWNHATGGVTTYVDGVVQNTYTISGTSLWSLTGGYLPWALTVGNDKSSGDAPYGGQFDGKIDDVVISDVYQDTAIFSRVPEPTTMVLLGMGAVMTLFRRRSR